VPVDARGRIFERFGRFGAERLAVCALAGG